MRLRIAYGLAFTLLTLRGDNPEEPRLLDMSVIALDNHDQPVNDLTVSDFEVTDGGKPQQIVFFRHRENGPRPPEKLAPNEISNRGASSIPYATVILFDLMNEGFASRGMAANEIVKSLSKLQTADYLYLYILTVEGRLYAVRGLPTGEERAEPAPWTSQIKQRLDAALRAVQRGRPVDVDVAIRTQMTFAALDGLGLELSRVPGRKNVVWVTDGVPIGLGPVRSDTGDFVDFTPQLRQLSQALERSGVAIYPVRQVMLGSADNIGANSDGAGATGGAGTGLQSIATLNEFANVTGGRPNTVKDIGGALKQAMNDVRVSYQIGYYAPPNNWDGKFHKVRVICKRKGVRIQSKTGYYAWATRPGERTDQAVRAAVGTQFDAAEIGLRGTLTADPKDKHSMQLTVRIDAGDVAFGKNGDSSEAQLRVAAIGYMSGGLVSGSPIMPLDLHYSAAEREKARAEGIPFSSRLPIADQVGKVRLIVFDRGSNAVGSLTFLLNAPAR